MRISNSCSNHSHNPRRLPSRLGNSQVILASSLSIDASAEEEKHTRFLRSLGGILKAFRVPSKAKKPDGSVVELETPQSQAD